jgi:hypothetical protein
MNHLQFHPVLRKILPLALLLLLLRWNCGNKAKEEVIKSMKAQLGAQSWRAHTTGTNSRDGNINRMIEYAAPDRYRIISDSELPGQGAHKRETIIIGDKTFVKKEEEPWKLSTMDVGALFSY